MVGIPVELDHELTCRREHVVANVVQKERLRVESEEALFNADHVERHTEDHHEMEALIELRERLHGPDRMLNNFDADVPNYFCPISAV